MKKIFKTISTLIMALIALSVIYTMSYRTGFFLLNNNAVKKELQIDFSESGKGITWIKKGNKQTLFFIPSSEEIVIEELYGSWLKELHEELSVNIIIPPLDPMGLSPGLFRQNISIERRTLINDYLYNLYRDQMGDAHKITILSTGDGSIQALELAKKYSGSDKFILISPVHNNQSISGGTIFHKLSGVPLVHYLIPWLPDSYGSHRMASYDILNDKLNEDFQNLYGKNYPRYINMYYRRDIGETWEKESKLLNKWGYLKS